jgi:uncharacterized protein
LGDAAEKPRESGRAAPGVGHEVGSGSRSAGGSRIAHRRGAAVSAGPRWRPVTRKVLTVRKSNIPLTTTSVAGATQRARSVATRQSSERWLAVPLIALPVLLLAFATAVYQFGAPPAETRPIAQSIPPPAAQGRQIIARPPAAALERVTTGASLLARAEALPIAPAHLAARVAEGASSNNVTSAGQGSVATNLPVEASIAPVDARMPAAETDALAVPADPVAVCVVAPKFAAGAWSPEHQQSTAPVGFGLALAKAARAQLEDLVVYDPRYRAIAYPMGDVPSLFGVCTDVVVRAYRTLGIDLQVLVHRSRTGRGDPHIDHRRVEVLRRFFAHHGIQLPISDFAEDYLPGDIVTYWRPQNRTTTTHIAIVTDRIAASGRPMIIHNRGWGPQLEDALFVDRITGHYRFGGMHRQPEPTSGMTLAPIPLGGPREPVTAVKRHRRAVVSGVSPERTAGDAGVLKR